MKSTTPIGLCTALLTWSLAGFAGTPTITCPPVNLVSQAWQQMDDAIPDDRNYIVTTRQPAFVTGNRSWVVRTVVPAHNQQDAIKLAQITVREAKSLMTPDAVKIGDKFGCVYFSPRAFVYALTRSSE